jgi:4-amino-4-deoxy-L-arabinose transferase-like glycosyltransferase
MRRRAPILAGVAAFLAAIVLYGSTPRGLGMNPDSVVYFTAAKNALEGRGFWEFGEPLTLHAAGYPALLSIGFRLGDPMIAARILHAVIFGLNVFLVGIAAARFTGGSAPAALLSILFFLSSQHVWGVHSIAWSEGPFIALCLASTLLFATGAASRRRMPLLASAVLLGLAAWTRYLGAVFLPPMLVCLWISRGRPTGARIREGVLFGSIALAPLVAWTIRNWIVSGSAADRSFHPHPIGAGHLLDLVRVGYEFLLPIDLWAPLQIVQLVFLASLAMIALRALRRGRPASEALREPAEVFHGFAVLLIPTYVASLLFSISFLDALTRVDYRILTPLYPFTVLLAVSLVWNLSKERGGRLLRQVFLAASFFLIATQADRAIAHVSTTHRFGRGYTNETWRNSEGIRFAESLAERKIIYSNAPEAILFLAGREARMLPRPVSPNTLAPNRRLREELDKIRAETESGEAAVLYFETVEREHMPGIKEFERLTGLAPGKLLHDAVFYGVEDAVVER